MSISTITQNNNHSDVSLPRPKKGLKIDAGCAQKVDQIQTLFVEKLSPYIPLENSVNPRTKPESFELFHAYSSGVDLPLLEEPKELQFDDRGLQDSFIRRVIDEVGLDDGEDDDIELDDDLRYIKSCTTYEPSKEKELSEATTPKLEEQEQEFPVTPIVWIVHPNGIVSTGKEVCPRDRTS